MKSLSYSTKLTYYSTSFLVKQLLNKFSFNIISAISSDAHT